MTDMNDLIRGAARFAWYVSIVSQQADPANDDLGEHLTPDGDQGKRGTAVHPSASAQMNDRIRRAAGINIRPGQRTDTPEIGDY